MVPRNTVILYADTETEVSRCQTGAQKVHFPCLRAISFYKFHRQQCVGYVADPRAPTTPTGHHKQRIRCSMDKASHRYRFELSSVRRDGMPLSFPEQHCSYGTTRIAEKKTGTLCFTFFVCGSGGRRAFLRRVAVYAISTLRQSSNKRRFLEEYTSTCMTSTL